MREADFTRLREVYIRRSTKTIIAVVKESHRNRGMVEMLYLFQLAQLNNMQRDEYGSHLVDLFNEVKQRGLSFESFLREAEHYRRMMLLALSDNKAMREEIIYDEAVYKERDIAKCKVVLRYFAALHVAELLYDMIQMWFPLSPVVFGKRKSNALVESLSGSLFARIKSQKRIKPQPKDDQKLLPEPAKERRIEYPEEMNSEEAAEYLSTTVDNLYQLTSSKQIPYYKRGRKLMFRKSELTGWRLQKVMSDEEFNEKAIDRRISKHRYRPE